MSDSKSKSVSPNVSLYIKCNVHSVLFCFADSRLAKNKHIDYFADWNDYYWHLINLISLYTLSLTYADTRIAISPQLKNSNNYSINFTNLKRTRFAWVIIITFQSLMKNWLPLFAAPPAGVSGPRPPSLFSYRPTWSIKIRWIEIPSRANLWTVVLVV